MGVRVKAYAKLNLTLAITGVEGGYHTLDSLVCSLDIYDLIKMSKRKDNLVGISMHGCGSETIEFESNNAVKAAESYIGAFGTHGVDIEIFKNIPLGAGLGGSSADAAGVLHGMSKLYGSGSERELKAMADTLGSDTGYMLSGGYARLTGRGEKVCAIDCKSRLHFLLLLPPDGVSTAECYKLYDEMPKPHKSRESLCNSLYEPACRLNGNIKTAYEELTAFSPLGVNMTGSGSCVYALFENAEYCAWAKSRYRGKFKIIQTKTV